MTASYIYVPPTWRTPIPMAGRGALRVSFETSTCVYRRGGVWHNVMTASEQDVAAYDTWVNPSDASDVLPLFFTRPTPIPAAIATELQALVKADPSWADAQFINLSVFVVFVNPDGTLSSYDAIDNGDGTYSSPYAIDNGGGIYTAP